MKFFVRERRKGHASRSPGTRGLSDGAFSGRRLGGLGTAVRGIFARALAQPLRVLFGAALFLTMAGTGVLGARHGPLRLAQLASVVQDFLVGTRVSVEQARQARSGIFDVFLGVWTEFVISLLQSGAVGSTNPLIGRLQESIGDTGLFGHDQRARRAAVGQRSGVGFLKGREKIVEEPVDDMAHETGTGSLEERKRPLDREATEASLVLNLGFDHADHVVNHSRSLLAVAKLRP